jgi:DNA primase
MEGEPKYIWPRGFIKSLELFGAWQLKNEARPFRVAYLVESPFCVMKFAQMSLPAVSPFGWTVSEPQALILAQLAKGWIYLPDRDKFDEGTRHIGTLTRHCWVKSPKLPPGIEDPEALSAEAILALT